MVSQSRGCEVSRCATPRPRNFETAQPLIAKNLPQAIERSLHILPLAIDFIRPSSKLIESDRRRLVEVFLVEEDASKDVSENADRAVVRRRGAIEKNLSQRTGTAVAPQHSAVGIDVAKSDAGRCGGIGMQVWNRA